MKYHLLLSSVNPVQVLPTRTVKKLDNAPRIVLNDAKNLVKPSRGDETLSNCLQEAIRAYYHTQNGYIAVHFVRISAEDVAYADLILMDSSFLKKESRGLMVPSGGEVSGDNFGINQANEHAELLLGAMGLVVVPPNPLPTTSSPSTSQFTFGNAGLIPPHETWDNHALIRNYEEALSWFQSDFGARFIYLGDRPRNDVEAARDVWARVAAISNISYDLSDISNRGITCTKSGSVVFPPQLIVRVPPNVLKSWSNNQHTSTLFPQHHLIFSGFLQSFSDHDPSQFFDQSRFGATSLIRQSPDVGRYMPIDVPESEFTQLFPVKGYYETFPLVHRVCTVSRRNYYIPIDEIAQNSLLMAKHYICDPGLATIAQAASNGTDCLEVLRVARIVNTRIPLQTLPAMTVDGRVDVVNHLVDYAYHRLVFAARRDAVLSKGKEDATYGELLSSLLERLIHIHQLSPQDNIVDIGCGIGNISLYYSLRFEKAPLGIELRADLDPVAHNLETLVEYSARRWGLRMSIPRRILGNVLTNTECQEALRHSTFVIINNYKFEPATNHNVTSLLEGLEGHRVIITTSPLYLPSHYRRDSSVFEKAVSWTDKPITIYSYSNK